MRVVEDSHSIVEDRGARGRRLFSMVEDAESVVEDSHSMVEDCGVRGRRLAFHGRSCGICGRRFVFYGRSPRCAW
ncbi:hypothetical protein [Paracerasibacillus soli]|uniref:Uncharacterized protein n=1 Tax=Paracerasibacillus soli TaxID=480284 RepID=A0ABU5CVA6_9BACI|nr:hypothetical protein [Virgibacillus soli]MDY0409375.1 hypothetical protein [Virgibacillus soli]